MEKIDLTKMEKKVISKNERKISQPFQTIEKPRKQIPQTEKIAKGC
jgi:hypothetical protein